MKFIFARSPLQSVHLFICLCLSVILMTLDQRQHATDRLRFYLSAALVPLQYVVDAPVQLWEWARISFTKQQELIKENTTLRAQLLLQQAEQQRLLAVQKENEQLRALLQAAPERLNQIQAAHLLSVSRTPYKHELILDKGTRHNIYTGETVLDAFGVIGQVVFTGPWTSRVMLVTDPRSAISVQSVRTGSRYIAVGSGNDTLLLTDIPYTTDLQEGDWLITSGLGYKFPYGYPLGRVIHVTRDLRERYTKVEVIPAAQLNHSRLVLLLEQSEARKIAQEIENIMSQPLTKSGKTS